MTFHVGNVVVGGSDLALIAEIGAGHGGDFEEAAAMIQKAKEAGFSAVKLQCYTPSSMTLKCDRPEYTIQSGEWAGKTLWDLYSAAATPREWFPRLFEVANRLDIPLFASPFSPDDVVFLEGLKCPAYKIASCEVGHADLIDAIAETGKPVFVSTAMAGADEIRFCVNALMNEICIMHCVAGYPTPAGECNLARIRYLQDKFGNPIGFSDHSAGLAAAPLAIAAGATVIEKHVAYAGSFDESFGLRLYELASFVSDCKAAFRAMHGPSPSEVPSRQFVRSIRATRDIAIGEKLTRDNIAVLRPAGFFSGVNFLHILGRAAKRDIPFGADIKPEDIGS